MEHAAHRHATAPLEENTDEAEFWDAHYAEKAQRWSGDPNVELVRQIAGLSPGTALDLGCGEGADAIWLARRGWRVVGVDISQVALDRAAVRARSDGVAERITWERRDLTVSFPSGQFDLVSAQFLHSPTDVMRERVLRRAPGAVAPGGVLFVVGHGGFRSDGHNPHPDVVFPTVAQVLESLHLDARWDVVLCSERERPRVDAEGRSLTWRDNVVLARRPAS